MSENDGSRGETRGGLRSRTAPEVRFRPATPGDAAAIVAFNQRMALETEGAELDGSRVLRGVAALLDDASKGFYLVAERTDESELVGQIMVTREWSDWRAADFWWVQSVYVVPEARRFGVYSRLHREVERRAVEEGACGLRLYVDRENHRAQATYRALGMERTRYDMYEIELGR